MSASKRSEVVAAIRVFSALLSHHPISKAAYDKQAAGDEVRPRRRKKVSLIVLNHLCTLLHTGRPICSGMAATGHIGPGTADVTVVVSSKSDKPDSPLNEAFDDIHILPAANFTEEVLDNLPPYVIYLHSVS